MSQEFPIPNTGISVITNRLWSLAVFYQILSGNIDKATHIDGVWKPNEILQAKPVDGSQLASITYSGGKQIRVYYLDTNYVVQEYCYTEGKGWYNGEIGHLNARATPGSGLAAIVFGALELGGGEPGEHIRVYYQEAGTNAVKELANDGSWYHGGLSITNASAPTSLAAVTYYFQHQTQIRVYYQDKELHPREFGHNGSGWFQGEFNPGQATSETPISAIAFGGVELQVYWRDLHGHVVFSSNTGSWGSPRVITQIGPGYRFAVLQWENGKHLRIYYQVFAGYLVEYCSDDGGKTWFEGKFRIAGVPE